MPKAKRFGVIGIQDSGKTTLVQAMVQLWTSQGLRVGVIKHDGHLQSADVDDWEKAGADTLKFASAGAQLTLLAGGGRSLLRTSRDRAATEENAEVLCDRLESVAVLSAQNPLDVIVVEGFKHSSLPKVVVLRRESDITWLKENIDKIQKIKAVFCSQSLLDLVELDWQVYDEKRLPLLCADLLTQL